MMVHQNSEALNQSNESLQWTFCVWTDWTKGILCDTLQLAMQLRWMKRCWKDKGSRWGFFVSLTYLSTANLWAVPSSKCFQTKLHRKQTAFELKRTDLVLRDFTCRSLWVQGQPSVCSKLQVSQGYIMRPCLLKTRQEED